MTAIAWYDVVGGAGVAAIIGSYLLLQLRRLESDSPAYSAANLGGALCVIVSLVYDFNLSAFVVEAFWAAISLFGLLRAWSASRSMPPRPSTENLPRLTVEAARERLMREAREPFVTLFRHGSLEVEFYQPVERDLQQPHPRDEVYVVASGRGLFVNGAVRHPFEPGEVLFVPAGRAHRFEDFTEDFSTWVFFYGPEGGEAS